MSDYLFDAGFSEQTEFLRIIATVSHIIERKKGSKREQAREKDRAGYEGKK